MSQTWRLNLLGTLTAQRSGQHITRFRTQKTIALLGYLAYYPRPHTREALIDLFWPDANLEQGRNSLSVSLSSLRRQLEPPGVEAGSIISTHRTLVSLYPKAITTDIEEFRALLSRVEALNPSLIFHRVAGKGSNESSPGNIEKLPTSPAEIVLLQRAIDLYRGHLLEGLYEDWCERERETLENLFLRALDHLVLSLLRQGDSRAAQQYAERAIACAPWREASHLNLMRSLVAQGDTEMALRHCQHLVQNGGASTEIRRMADSIRRGETSHTFQIASSLPPQEIRQYQETTQILSPALPEVSAPKKLDASPASVPDTLASSFNRGNLPVHRTRFFGRRALQGRLIRQLAPSSTSEAVGEAGVRLMTLTGMGGSGKTRLAIETALRLFEKYQQRLWFVPLTGLLDASLLHVAVRDALGVKPEPNAAPLEQVVELLASAPAMLVFDNFETLLPDGAKGVALLLTRVPHLRCLVTSRQRLELEGEVEIVVRPLPIPRPTNQPQDVSKLLRFAGVRLFVDRAIASRPDFGLTKRNAATVTQLCRALEGVPLALELAAARSSALSPTQMLEHLESRSDLLQSSRHDVPSRHRSMQAAIDTSYQLLTPELQQFFRRQWVFRGGWQPAAAAVICQEPRALHFATQLRTCSLLVSQERAEEVRFSSLETLRDFAGAQLSSEEKTRLQRLHAHHYFEQLPAQIPTNLSAQSRAVANFQADLNNYRAALEWALEHEPILALQLATALAPWWEISGHVAEGIAQFKGTLQAAPEAPPELRAQALYRAGKISYFRDFETSQPFLEASLEIYRALSDWGNVAEVLCLLSLVLMNLKKPGAQEAATEARLLAQRVGNRDLEVQAIQSLAGIVLGEDDLDAARPLFEECIAHYRASQNIVELSKVLDMLGMTYWRTGEWERARQVFEESVSCARQTGQDWMLVHSLWGVAAVACEQGDLEKALVIGNETLARTRDGRLLWYSPYMLACVAYIEINRGRIGRAVTMLGAAEAQHEQLQMPLVPLFVPTHERYLQKARAALSPAQFEKQWEKGREMDFEGAIAFALQDKATR